MIEIRAKQNTYESICCQSNIQQFLYPSDSSIVTQQVNPTKKESIHENN